MTVCEFTVCRHRFTPPWSRRSYRGSSRGFSGETTGSGEPSPAARSPSDRRSRASHRLRGSLATTLRTTVAIACLLLGVQRSGAVEWLWSRSAEVPQQPHPAVVRVSVDEADGTSYGSGTLVGVHDRFGLVVTNWHVVRDAAGAIHVTFPDGFRSASRVLRVDRDWDLAALLIWRPRVTPVPIAPQAPQPGEPLTIAGYGAGNYRAATGRCTQYVAPSARHPFEMVEIAARARQGDSGGPIFNSAGELAGVLFGSGGGTTSGSYAGRVRQFLLSAWSPSQESEYPESLAATPRASHPPAPLQRLPDTAQALEKPGVSPRLAPLPAAGNLAASNASPSRSPTLLDAADSEPLPPATATAYAWHDIAGDSVFQQCKTFLAILGLFTLLAQFTRLLSPRAEVE